jgi:Flp pilus assembly protein TadG
MFLEQPSMAHKKYSNSTGQAFVEMLLVIPLLFLLTASTVQFTILFQARSAFDKACGEAARQYAANQLEDSSAIMNCVWNDMGFYQSYFNKQSLNISTQAPQTTIADTFFNAINSLGPLAYKIKSHLINYTGQTWVVTISCAPPPFIAVVFPNGIPFQSQLTVLKYPS